MFGPDTELLSGRHVIFVDVGDPTATAVARELFAPTMATLVEMDLESHDRLIAYVLGLSHALNIAFFTALADSGEAAPRLATLSSTTFDAQLGSRPRSRPRTPTSTSRSSTSTTTAPSRCRRCSTRSSACARWCGPATPAGFRAG
jgi:chorismate mutase/prephenate dehydrogenase